LIYADITDDTIAAIDAFRLRLFAAAAAAADCHMPLRRHSYFATPHDADAVAMITILSSRLCFAMPTPLYFFR